MFMLGKQLYGKTDHLKGLFYVATNFVSINFFPIIPLGSYCLLDKGGAVKGVKIPWSWKSMLLGYFRGFVCVLSITFMALGVCFVILDFRKIKWLEFPEPVQMIACSLLGALVLCLSYLWQRPKPLRALELAKLLDVPISVLAGHFENDPRIEELMFRTQDETTPPGNTDQQAGIG